MSREVLLRDRLAWLLERTGQSFDRNELQRLTAEECLSLLPQIEDDFKKFNRKEAQQRETRAALDKGEQLLKTAEAAFTQAVREARKARLAFSRARTERGSSDQKRLHELLNRVGAFERAARSVSHNQPFDPDLEP